MDLELIRLFVDVVQRGGFTAAARARNIDPSTVARAIASLEEHLSIRLLERTTRRMQLTDAGKLYLLRVEGLVEAFDTAADSARELASVPAGKLRITASVAYGQRCLVPLLPSFQARYPAISLELLLSDQTLDLFAERIDLAVRIGVSMPPGVICTKLAPMRYRVVASPAYLGTHDPLNRPEDLQRHQCLIFSLQELLASWRFRRKQTPLRDVTVSSTVAVSGALALRECALIGLGPSMLPDWLVDDDIAKGTLVDVFPSWECTPTEFGSAVWILYSTREFLPAKVRAMVDFLKRRQAEQGRSKRNQASAERARNARGIAQATRRT